MRTIEGFDYGWSPGDAGDDGYFAGFKDGIKFFMKHLIKEDGDETSDWYWEKFEMLQNDYPELWSD